MCISDRQIFGTLSVSEGFYNCDRPYGPDGYLYTAILPNQAFQRLVLECSKFRLLQYFELDTTLYNGRHYTRGVPKLPLSLARGRMCGRCFADVMDLNHGLALGLIVIREIRLLSSPGPRHRSEQ